ELLYQAWRLWCDKVGRKEPGTRQIFGRDLRAAVPGLKTTQPRDGDSRDRKYEGIGLETNRRGRCSHGMTITRARSMMDSDWWGLRQGGGNSPTLKYIRLSSPRPLRKRYTNGSTVTAARATSVAPTSSSLPHPFQLPTSPKADGESSLT